MFRRIRLVAAGAVFAVLAGSGLAWAAADDAASSQPGDTFFTFGYDVENHLLITGIHPLQAVEPVDCTVAAGTYDVGYGIADGTVSVDAVEGGDGPVVFSSGGDVEDGEITDLAYGEDGNPCTLAAIVVAGPNGQVNHGQVVSAFSQALDIAGKGCVMRWIAQSGFGKGDEQVRTQDVDPAFAPMDTGTIDLVTVLAACDKGGAEVDDTDDGAGDGSNASDVKPGKADKPAKADKAAPGKPESPGNSANAPGHNK